MVTRGNRRIAEIRPAARRTGRDLAAALAGTSPPTMASPTTSPQQSGCSRSTRRTRGPTSNPRHQTSSLPTRRNEFDRTILDDADVAISRHHRRRYRTAIELAGGTEQAQARTRALTAIVGAVEVLDYSTSTAIHHARLIAHVRQQGRPRGPRSHHRQSCRRDRSHAVEPGRRSAIQRPPGSAPTRSDRAAYRFGISQGSEHVVPGRPGRFRAAGQRRTRTLPPT